MNHSRKLYFRALTIALLVAGCSDEPTRPSHVSVPSRPNASLIPDRGVLLLHADHPYHNEDPANWFRSQLSATGLLNQSQISIQQMAPGAIPPLDPSNQACVIVWTNDELPNGLTESHMVAFGDALKRYVDLGGGVILMEGSFRGETWARVRMRGGIMEDGYSPLDPVGPNEPSEPHRLDFSTALTSHPILSGVTEFSYGTFGNYFAGATLDPGATLVGRDHRSVPLIALSKSGRVAAINVYPGHVNPLPSNHKSPGVFRAIANACRTVANRAPVVQVANNPDGLRNLAVDVNASALDPDPDDVLQLSWDFGDGSTATTSGSVQTMKHTFTTFGVFTVRLTARDRFGGVTEATGTVTVTAGKRALLLHADHPYHGVDPAEWLRQSLVGTGVFRSDQITIREMTPSISDLEPSQYSCVAVWTNNELPNGLTATDMAAHGDALKRYVDAGGGVVIMQGAFFPDEYERIRLRGGITADGYSPLDPAPLKQPSEVHQLNFSTALTGHSILAGVNDFRWGRSPNYFPGAILDAQGILVANDTRGVPTIAINQSGRVVAMNVYPGHVDPVPSTHKSPGVYRAIANACVTTASGSGTPTSTPTGTNVTVEPVIVDATGTPTTPVAVTFANLLIEGTTTASVVPTPTSPLPTGFKVEPATFYDISTTATFLAGTQIEVCVDYDPSAFQSSDDVRLLHGEHEPESPAVEWVDRTSRVDPVARQVCATVSSLSPFAVVTRNRPPAAHVSASRSTIDEGSSITFDASASTDADGTVASYSWSFDGGTTFTTPSAHATTQHTFAQDGGHTVIVRVQDDRGAIGTATVNVSVSNVLPTVGVSATQDPVALSGGTAQVPITATFSDPGTLDPHVTTVNCGNGTSTTTTPFKCVYTTPGVYSVRATVTDDDGAQSAVFDYIVVYDPTGGFVTGGGWIDSPNGACAWAGCATDGSTVGKASFGFVAKYQKGASAPTGDTEFQFKAGDLSFASTAYQWLVVAGARAQYKGEGTINGQGRYGFLLTAIDGQATGGDGVDRFRLKIWDRDANDRVVYDNQLGAVDGADPTTTLGGGSIVLHVK